MPAIKSNGFITPKKVLFAAKTQRHQVIHFKEQKSIFSLSHHCCLKKIKKFISCLGALAANFVLVISSKNNGGQANQGTVLAWSPSDYL